MKKYIYHIIIVSVLLIVAIVVFMKDKKGTLNFDFKGFSVKDTSVVTSIRIKDNSATLLLERKGSKWIVNKKYNANPRAIQKLLGSIRHFEINSPVPKKLKKEILDKLNNDAILVTIESAGETIKKYRMIDNEALNGGSVVLLDGSNDPYLVDAAGFGGRLTVFFTTNTFIWRDRTVFRYNPNEILAVEVNYPNKQEASFTMSFLGEKNTLLRSLNTNKITKVHRDQSMQYLMNFHSVAFHWIAPEHVKQVNDSLSNQKPYCEIKVKNIENQISLVKTFRIPTKDKPGDFNLDKMYAVFQEDSVPVYVKYIDIDPVMKEYTDFAKP